MQAFAWEKLTVFLALIIGGFFWIRSHFNKQRQATADFIFQEQRANFTTDILAAYKASGAPTIISSYLNQLLRVFQLLYDSKPPTTRVAHDLCLKTCSDSLIGFANKSPKILIAQSVNQSVFTQIRDTRLEVFNGATGALVDPAFETGAYTAYGALAAPFKDKNSPILRGAGLFDWDNMMHEIHYTVDIREPGNFSDEMGVSWLDADKATRRDWERRNEKYHNAYTKAFDRAIKESLDSYSFIESRTSQTPLFRYAGLLEPPPTINVPFNIPDKFRFDGMWIVAPPDSGKTTFISAMIADDLKRVAKGECSIFVMDSQNELIPDIAQLELFAPGRPLHGKLIYLEPSSRYPLSLNIFDTKHHGSVSDDEEMAIRNSAIWMIEFLLKSLVKSDESSHQETYLQFVIPAVLAIPDATIFTLMELLEPPPPKSFEAPGYERYKQYFGTLRPQFQKWLKERMHSTQLAATRDAIRARIEGIYARTFFYDMLVHPKNKFDFFSELQSGKVILVNTKKGLLKSDTEPFGKYFIARLLQAAEERMLIDRGKRLPVYAYIDEASDYLSDEETIEELIAKARKQKVAITVANQFESQIRLPVARDALSKAAIQCRGRPAPEGQTPNWQISINASQPVDIVVPNVRFSDMPRMSEPSFREILADMRRRFSSVSSPGPQPDAPQDESFYDYEWTITISPRLAATGGKTREHGYNINIPAGVRHGEVLRLRGAGRQKPDGTYGHAYITLNIPQRADQQTFGLGSTPEDETDAKPW